VTVHLGTLWARGPDAVDFRLGEAEWKSPVTRDDAVERVTRIELAWPAWKVAVLVLGGRLRGRPCALMADPG
jgi:hypothetical protein